MSQIRLIYFGIDDEMSTDLDKYCEEYVIGDHSFKSFSSKNSDLISSCLREQQNIVFLDFTKLENQEVIQLLDQVHFIKKQPTRRSTLFTVIFENYTQAKNYYWVCAKGIQVSIIKGQDTLSFFMDCYRIAVSEDYALPRYAKAENINKKLTLSCCSSVLALNDKHVLIETDINQHHSDQKLCITLPHILDIKYTEHKIREHHSTGFAGLGLDTYLLDLPLASPWDDISEDTIAPETVQTWLENHSDELTTVRPCIYLFNLADSKHLEAAYKLSVTNELDFMFEDENHNQEHIQNQLRLIQPPLIFIQLPPQEDDECDSFQTLETVINSVNNITNFNPIVIIGSSPSSTEAMRKTFDYSNLLSHSTKLDWDTIEKLALKFKEKKSDPTGIHHLEFLNAKSQTSYAEVSFDVEVTSLTEHEITFYSKRDLPMFSVFKIDLPIPTMLTVIPPAYELESSPNGQHYMAILHGPGEEDLNRLRKFVNQIIYRPLNEFSEQEVKKILEQKPYKSEDDAHETQQQTDKQMRPKYNAENMRPSETYKRTIINGRSKL